MSSWQLINFCEIDKYAIQSYCAIHNIDESLNLGDITKVDETKLHDFNLMTWGFPCTDISIAGVQKGFTDEDGNNTRSGLYYEGIRILRYKKPAISIIENVKNLTSKKFKKEFEMILKDLDEAGYNSYYKVLNSKLYNTPQTRERVFIISIRKNLDNGKFVFPVGFDSGIRLIDLLDKEVDESYYLSKDRINKLVADLDKETIKIRRLNPKECFRIMGFSDEHYFSAKTGSIITAQEILSKYKGKAQMDEAIRLSKMSDRQLYKQIGNSIVVNVLFYIFIELYKAMPYLFEDIRLCSLFSGIGSFEIALNKLYNEYINSDFIINKKEPKTNNGLIFIGGIESNKWIKDGKSLSRNYKQGYRVYDSRGIACALTSNCGGPGFFTVLYLV